MVGKRPKIMQNIPPSPIEPDITDMGEDLAEGEILIIPEDNYIRTEQDHMLEAAAAEHDVDSVPSSQVGDPLPAVNPSNIEFPTVASIDQGATPREQDLLAKQSDAGKAQVSEHQSAARAPEPNVELGSTSPHSSAKDGEGVSAARFESGKSGNDDTAARPGATKAKMTPEEVAKALFLRAPHLAAELLQKVNPRQPNWELLHVHFASVGDIVVSVTRMRNK
jgi:hypothetical protein